MGLWLWKVLVVTIGASDSGRKMLLYFSINIIARNKHCIMFLNGIGQMHLGKRSIVLKGHGRFSLGVTVWNLHSVVIDVIIQV